MAAGAAPTFRIVPRKGFALLYTAFFLIFLVMVLNLFLAHGVVTANGHGADIVDRLAIVPLFVLIPLANLIWYGRRLLPGSPFDGLELGPDGLTVAGLFGRERIAWENIAGFSVGNVPLSRQPITWIKVVPRDSDARPVRFFMGGYIRFRFFMRMKTRMQVVADWLDQVRAAYVFDNALHELPLPPEELAAEIVTVPTEPGAVTLRSRSGVVER